MLSTIKRPCHANEREMKCSVDPLIGVKSQ